jgi:transcriptional regulator with XRE-family HTH domain
MHYLDTAALVTALCRIRERDFLTTQGMARKLGVSVGHLSMVFAGKRRPGLRFVEAALAAYPELRPPVARGLDDRAPGR